MRIRTIKPEFWSHPIIGRLPGDVQAVAIGLLNMADDEGYLLADAANVRSALRPFDDDSTNVRRALDELSRVGWLEVREHSSHGRIGRIPNFTAHQRIDRANDSKLKRYYDVAFDDDSTNVRRALGDETAEEGKGREQGKERNREQGGLRQVDQLRQIWNDNRGKLSEWKLTNAAREKVATTRLRELPLDQWADVVKRIAASNFCNGTNDRGWRASPDWLLKPSTAAAVLEGKYDNHGAATASQPTAAPHFG